VLSCIRLVGLLRLRACPRFPLPYGRGSDLLCRGCVYAIQFIVVQQVVQFLTRLHGPDVSRQGVQRDMLPLIEGSTVNTRHGSVKTDHILFVAAGAFHTAKPSDLMPELQGRLPIRVELQDLTKDDFVRILTEPRNALTKQQVALLGTEGVGLSFTRDAIEKLAEIAAEVNRSTENIGARRLQTILEKVMN